MLLYVNEKNCKVPRVYLLVNVVKIKPLNRQMWLFIWSKILTGNILNIFIDY